MFNSDVSLSYRNIGPFYSLKNFNKFTFILTLYDCLERSRILINRPCLKLFATGGEKTVVVSDNRLFRDDFRYPRPVDPRAVRTAHLGPGGIRSPNRGPLNSLTGLTGLLTPSPRKSRQKVLRLAPETLASLHTRLGLGGEGRGAPPVGGTHKE